MTTSLSAETLPEFDPYSEGYWNGAYATYQRLRDEAPIYRNERRNFWALSRHDDVHEAFRDFKTFSSSHGIRLNQLNTEGFNSERDFPGFIIGTDPPVHTHLRGLVSRSFSAKGISSLEESIRSSVRARMKRLSGQGEFDFCSEFADRVPAEVMYSLMGVPDEDRDEVFGYTRDFTDVGDAAADDMPASERQIAGQANMVKYVVELAERKRAHPENDLITEIIGKDIQRTDGTSSRLEPEEIGGFLLTLLGAGVETTTKMMAAGIVAFSRFPDQWQKVLDDPGKLPAAIEEIGRYEPPVQLMGRRSRRPVTLHGVTVPEESNFLLLIGATTRDDRVYDNPDRFDIDRVFTKAPLTFGFGPHLCVGAALARLEMRVAFEEISTQWPRFSIDETRLSRSRNFNTSGYNKVPITIG